MEPEPVIGVAAHIRFDHLCKHTRILDNILLQLPGATHRDFLTQDEPMMSLANAMAYFSSLAANSSSGCVAAIT